MTPEEKNALVDLIVSKVEERLEGKIKGVKIPETEIVRGSLVSPAMPKFERGVDEVLKDVLENLKNELINLVGQMIENSINDLKNEITNQTEENLYNTLNQYTTTEKLYNIFMNWGIGTGIRRAFCKTAAPASTQIVCYLDVDTHGPEITVTCYIAGGGNLNSALPYLTDGLQIPVWKDGTVWKCLWGFRKADICA